MRDFQNYWHCDEVDGDLDFIKFKISNFQGSLLKIREIGEKID
jgi:hypothetical protein